MNYVDAGWKRQLLIMRMMRDLIVCLARSFTKLQKLYANSDVISKVVRDVDMYPELSCVEIIEIPPDKSVWWDFDE